MILPNTPVVGWLPSGNSPSTATLTLNAALAGSPSYSQNWLALSFVGNGKTINEIEAYISAVNGTLVAADCVCDIFSSTAANVPNASVAGPNSCDSAPAAANWFAWSGFSYATTAGVLYWAVFRNANATPATNYPTFRWVTSHLPSWLGTSTLFGWDKIHTTDGGATWAGTRSRGMSSLILKFSDSTYSGSPVHAAATSAASSDQVQGTKECGAKFTTPAGSAWPVVGIVMPYNNITGAPAGSLRARLYEGATLIATSANALTSAQASANCTNYYPLASTVTLNPSTVYRCVNSATGSDTGANYYRFYKSNLRLASYARALLPFGACWTYTANATANPVVWTDEDNDTNSNACPFGLVLDDTVAWAAAGGGGLPIIGLGGSVVRAA